MMSINKTNQKQLFNKKNHYQFTLDKGRVISISSNFDNGNIALIKQQNQLSYRLKSVPDVDQQNNKKSWFYFKVNCSKNIRIRFIIENVNIFETMYQDKNWAKPVIKQSNSQQWKPIKDAYLTMREQIQLVIQHTFTQNNTQVSFALSVPFSYTECQKYLDDLRFKAIDSINYTDQIIGNSLQGRPIHLITIQQKISINSKQKFAQSIMKNDASNNNIKKPVVLITTRVHPGQVSSMYCLMGIIQFLLKPYNLQAHLLRKLFTFIIIPTVNPDGVYQGNYRMDTNGVNLNRFYSDPQQDKHPTVSSIKNLVTSIVKERKIQYHFDLHSHSSMKPAFIYGNALDDIITQTQSQLYCKILQQYTPNFKYSLCQFGQKHMKFKDKGQTMTKQGCARVVIGKLGNILNSYTVQTSIFPYFDDPNYEITLPTNRNFQIGQYTFQPLEKRYENNKVIKQNMELGYSLMASILQHIDKNPYSLIDSQLKNQWRKQISFQLLQNQERFKMLDIKAYQKSKMIIKHCKQQFTDNYAKQWSYLANDQFFANVQWPNGFKWFSKMIQFRTLSQKKIKLKTQGDKNCKSVQSLDLFVIRSSNKKKNQQQREKDKPQKQLSPLAKQLINFEYLPRIEKPLLQLKKTQREKDSYNNANNIKKRQGSDQRYHDKKLRSSLNIHQKQQKEKEKNYKKAERLKTINYNPLQQISKEKQQVIQLNALVQLKQIQLKSVKNNVIMEFIEQQIHRLNQKKKKQLPSYNRLVNYKASMRQKCTRMRNTSIRNKKSVKSAQKLFEYGNIISSQRQLGQNKVSNILFPIKKEDDQDDFQNQVNIKQRFQTISEEHIQKSLLKHKKKSIVSKQKNKIAQFKKKSNKQINLQIQKETDILNQLKDKIHVKLPNISQAKLLIDTRMSKKKSSEVLLSTDPGAKSITTIQQ